MRPAHVAFNSLFSLIVTLAVVGGLLNFPTSCTCGARLVHHHSIFQVSSHHHDPGEAGAADARHGPAGHGHDHHATAPHQHDPHARQERHDPRAAHAGDRWGAGRVDTSRREIGVAMAPETYGGPELRAQPTPAPNGQIVATNLIPLTLDADAVSAPRYRLSLPRPTGRAIVPEPPPPRA